MAESIHPDAYMGPVALTVADLARSRRYYVERIGLSALAEQDGALILGVVGRPLLYLYEQPGARQVHNTSGLYHFALLLPSRLELARTLRHLIDTGTPLTGASDHAVSEALYLSDPDGHGIEIYRDRPRSEWRYPGGVLKMTVDPFDAEGVLAELDDATAVDGGMPAGTVMGHVHLHVADLAAAEQFYVDVLGMDLMVRYGNMASFVAAGGYHHHVGLNIWAGVGAPPPPADAARLRWATLVLPDADALAAVKTRLEATGSVVEQRGSELFVHDPSANPWRIVTAGA
jgi:catechol 2,3-dioxygenase